MFTETQFNEYMAVASMVYHPGTYRYLCECENGTGIFLAHHPVGHILYDFHPELP